MANETSNQTAENNTAEGNLTAIIDTVEESGLLDTIMDEPLLMALVALVLGLGAYVAYTVPAVKALVFKYLKNNEAELMELLDKNLTKAQIKAYEKLDEQAQLHNLDPGVEGHHPHGGPRGNPPAEVRQTHAHPHAVRALLHTLGIIVLLFLLATSIQWGDETNRIPDRETQRPNRSENTLTQRTEGTLLLS